MSGEPQPGQVWRPGLPGSGAKLVTRLSSTGGVYAVGYPMKRPHIGEGYFTRQAWDMWVRNYRALPEARAVSLSEARDVVCR